MEGTPTCYRHPTVSAYVRCQRCERQVCPDCQIPAAVGVVCPECFDSDRKSTPRPSVAKTLRARSGGAPATMSLIVLTTAVFLLQLIPAFAVTEALLFAGVYVTPTYFEPWRLITTAFVHSTGMIFHVPLNMYTLWIFGRLVEPFLGTGRFLALYLLSALGGSVGVLWLSNPLTPVVGASGAIFGLIGAFIVIHRSLGGSAPQLYLLLGLNLAIGFLPGMSIAWEAHLGGLAVGVLIGWIYSSTRLRTQQRQQRWSMIALAVVLVVLSLRYVLFA